MLRHVVSLTQNTYRCAACRLRGDLAWATSHVARHQYQAKDR